MPRGASIGGTVREGGGLWPHTISKIYHNVKNISPCERKIRRLEFVEETGAGFHGGGKDRTLGMNPEAPVALLHSAQKQMRGRWALCGGDHTARGTGGRGRGIARRGDRWGGGDGEAGTMQTRRGRTGRPFGWPARGGGQRGGRVSNRQGRGRHGPQPRPLPTASGRRGRNGSRGLAREVERGTKIGPPWGGDLQAGGRPGRGGGGKEPRGQIASKREPPVGGGRSLLSDSSRLRRPGAHQPIHRHGRCICVMPPGGHPSPVPGHPPRHKTGRGGGDGGRLVRNCGEGLGVPSRGKSYE